MSGDSAELENYKILRSIWKNTFDKILEIKVKKKFLIFRLIIKDHWLTQKTKFLKKIK